MPHQVAAQWSISPGVTYLNHGSFGPSPRTVTDVRFKLQRQLESNPMEFLLRQLPEMLDGARTKLAEFIGADADDLALVDNATMGMNIVAATVKLKPGDEVLCNDHEYGAVLRLWERACQRARAKLVVQKIPLPIGPREETAGALLQQASDHTRLIVFSHVTSPTAVIFPAEEICRRARKLGIAVCIDGPHALAMLPLNLESLDCDFYTASCHKWLSAPFGSGFLYVHPRWQREVRPVLVSWGLPWPGEAPSWRDEFHWQGTRDPTSWLSVPAAIDFLQEAGLQDFRRRSHDLVRYARERISEFTGLPPLTPDDPSAYGSMAALPLSPGEAEPLQRKLWEQHRIEIPLIDWNGRRLIRVSCHLYNSTSDIDRLVDALRKP